MRFCELANILRFENTLGLVCYLYLVILDFKIICWLNLICSVAAGYQHEFVHEKYAKYQTSYHKWRNKYNQTEKVWIQIGQNLQRCNFT